MNKPKIRMSICTYNDGLFEVMIVDEETQQEIRLEGNRKLTDEEFDLIQKVAPACVCGPPTSNFET